VTAVTFPYDPDRQWVRPMLAFGELALSTDRTLSREHQTSQFFRFYPPKMAIEAPSEVDIDRATFIGQCGDTEARPPEVLSDPSTTDVHASLPAGLAISD